MTQRLREKDLQRLALRLADAMSMKEAKSVRPSNKPSVDKSRMEKGVKAAISAFHASYSSEGGNPVASGFDHDDEAEETGDAGTGDGSMGGMGGSRMAPGAMVTADDDDDRDPDDDEDDLVDSDKPENWTDDMQRVSRAGRDKSRAEDSFGKSSPTKVLKAAYKCSRCGESNVVKKFSVSESTSANALRHVQARCRSCGETNLVRAPKNHAYTTEAVATFAARYKRESR